MNFVVIMVFKLLFCYSCLMGHRCTLSKIFTHTHFEEVGVEVQTINTLSHTYTRTCVHVLQNIEADGVTHSSIVDFPNN